MVRHPSPDELGEPILKVLGFQLWVHGRQFEQATDYEDGNWLRVTAHCGAAGASVWATGSILQAQDVLRWAEGCDALVQGSKTPAELWPAEPNLHISISPKDPFGHFEMRVAITPELGTQEHTFTFELDQTYLPDIIRQCKTLLTL